MKLAAAFLAITPIIPGSTLCEPSPEVRRESKRFEISGVGGEKRREHIRRIAEELLSQYPLDYFILNRLERTFHYEPAERRAGVPEKIKQLAEANPDNAGVAVVYAKSLIDHDTARALELLKKLDHPYAHLALVDIYTFGKYADRAQGRKHIDAYFAACPETADAPTLSLVQRHATPELAKQHAPRLRKILLQEKDPEKLRAWEPLWGLEFKAAPPAEHDKVRKQIKADLSRLESLEVPQTEQWFAFLLAGYRQANEQEQVKRLEDKLIRDYAKTSIGRSTSSARFYQENPWPKPTDSEEAKQKFYKTQLSFADEQLKLIPGEFQYLMMRFDALSQMKDAKPEDVAAAGNAKLAAIRSGTDWSGTPPFEWRIASAFVKHKVELDQVPGLIDEGWKGHRARRGFKSDREPEERSGDFVDDSIFLKAEAAKILVDAAKELKKPEIARAAVDELKNAKPEKPYDRVSVWSVLARHAEAEGRKLDALLMYKTALDARPPDVKPPVDELRDNIARLYKELGGTDAALDLWNTRGKKVEVAGQDGRWETPKKSMPEWELADLAGKTWKLRSLEGKTLLINVWASWCGPCRVEHPYLEKLYQKVKDRNDVQIVTFNIDDEIGLVKPYMDQQKFTFPVLLSKNYVEELLPLISIPRNWIVDASGKWRAEQIGFGHDENWENAMLQRLEQTKPE